MDSSLQLEMMPSKRTFLFTQLGSMGIHFRMRTKFNTTSKWTREDLKQLT